MLILFDIDGTMLRTGGAGLRAMTAAGRELIGPHFTMEGVNFAGRLDPLIWEDAARAAGVDDPDAHHEAFRASYTRLLLAMLAEERQAQALPGVMALIDALAAVQELTLGVVTGNYPETGRAKIAAAGLDPDVFVVAAWGSDGRIRRELPPIAMSRYAEHHGRAIEPHRVVVIGDTPHDVDCAKHSGCRSIAVATGPIHSIDELHEYGADLTLADLSDTDRLVEWILAAEEARSA
jgi:phosphoglycolate phosphatase